MPPALSVWIRNCLSIFCVTTLRLLCSVCLASQSKGFHFSSALEADLGFSGKAPRWVLRTNTAGSLWLQKGGAVSQSLFHFITYCMSILSCPCHCFHRFQGDG